MAVHYTDGPVKWYAEARGQVPVELDVDVAAIAADAVAFAELQGATGNEQVRIDWLEQRLADAPGSRGHDAVGNLVWSLGSGPQPLALLVHVDDVFDDATTTRQVVTDGEWLRGPGIGDNAAAVAVTLAVVEQLAPPLPLTVVFTVGEEGLGSLRGARHACAELRPRAAIALEGHGLDHVFLDAVGSVRLRLTVSGPGGHSWWDRGRPSALHGLVGILHRLLDTAPAGDRATINIGTVGGGSAVNAIAAEATAVVEWRSVQPETLAACRAAAVQIQAPVGLRLRVEELDARPAGTIGRDDPLAQAVLAARGATGLPDVVSDGSTDANAALALGIPALALGCCHGRDMHSPNERILTSSLDTGARQLAAVLQHLLDPTPAPAGATPGAGL